MSSNLDRGDDVGPGGDAPEDAFLGGELRGEFCQRDVRLHVVFHLSLSTPLVYHRGFRVVTLLLCNGKNPGHLRFSTRRTGQLNPLQIGANNAPERKERRFNLQRVRPRQGKGGNLRGILGRMPESPRAIDRASIAGRKAGE